MFDWLTQRKRMTGGLHFGAPGWYPHEIEGLQPSTPPDPHCNPDNSKTPPFPLASADGSRNCPAFLEALQRANIGRGSTIIPALAEQIADLGDRRIRSLVINLLPTQPEFAIAAGLTHVAFDELIEGISILQNFVRARRLTIVIDRHDHATYRRWKKARADSLVNYEIRSLLNRYPQSHHTVLLRTLYGKKILPADLPTRANRFIVDPVTCWALGRFARTLAPVTHRPVQIFVRESKRRTVAPRIVMAKIGESVAELCQRIGLAIAHRQLILNGMLTGVEAHPSTLITPDTESLAVRPRTLQEIPSPCIACGWCVDVCPTQLNPVGLFDLARRAEGKRSSGAILQVIPNDGESLCCISCGLCSYVCPTRLPLAQELTNLRKQAEAGLAISRKTNPEAAP